MPFVGYDENHHLYEYLHPGVYLANLGHDKKQSRVFCWPSWRVFVRETGLVEADRESNYLVRFDAKSQPHEQIHDPVKFFGYFGANPYEWPHVKPLYILNLHFWKVRWGYMETHDVLISNPDEPEIKAWLKTCAQAVQDTWMPFLPQPVELSPETQQTNTV